MASKSLRTSAAVMAMAGCFSLWLSRSTAQEDRAADEISKLVASAKQALEAYQTKYFVGQATVEEIYQWSRRLMDAELLGDMANGAPSRDHRDRMSKLHQRVAMLNRAGAVGGEQADLSATEFYLAEASLLLAR